MSNPAAVFEALSEEVETVLIGNEDIVGGLTMALYTRGHILLEGVPGVGKTTIANLFARATGLAHNRIQMTPDILPADITGTDVYRESTGEFHLQKGPVFANVVVADEINRATPKTQSALLEAMQERRVTIGGETHPLPEPFLVIATQNPIEMEGTYELPEAQRDRFQFKLTIDVPSRSNEAALVDRFDADPELGPEAVEQVVNPAELLAARESVTDVYVDAAVKEYLLDIVERTRDSPDVAYGASPRATLSFMNAGKARAALHGRTYVIPDDLKALAEPILSHRLVLSTDAELSDVFTRDVIEDVLASVTPPGSEAAADVAAVSQDGGTPAESDDRSPSRTR